jgi:hypothetical protein
MSQEEIVYRKKMLKTQIFIKLGLILLILVFLNIIKRKNDQTIFLDLFISKSRNINSQITLVIILLSFIIYTLIAGKISDLENNVYFSLLLFIYLLFIFYILLIIINSYSNLNNILIYNVKLSKILVFLSVIIILVLFFIQLYSLKKESNDKNNVLINLFIKDDSSEMIKFNLFLDTCLNFIILLAVIINSIKLIP